jgi:hypothetical protein
MKFTDPPRTHLTYCLNVHAGETWAENFQAIRDEALAVRDQVAPGGAFGLGLRLSNEASVELAQDHRIAEFKRFCDDEGLYVFTVNAFPYGTFHGRSVKADVYGPDWRDPRRREYTLRVATILAQLLPEDVPGSISTVPGTYKPWLQTKRDILDIAANLALTAHDLYRLQQETGRLVVLGLEPEPDCLLSTTDELIRFCRGPLQTWGFAQLAKSRALELSWASEVLWYYIGACLDLAHLAVEFEDPVASLAKLQRSGLTLAKLQLSAALEVQHSPEAMRRLRDFDEPVYLHQTKARLDDGRIVSYPDLPAALDAWDRYEEPPTWRTHFHVPLFFDSDGPLRSTRRLLGPQLMARLGRNDFNHLEIETYTFSVLPDFLQPASLAEGIAREYDWVRSQLVQGA